jgi:hypothetical protein
MAIYHFSVKTISRSSGRSVVAAAAYRSGEKLVCDFYGKEQDYTRKSGVEHAQIYAPDNTNEKLLDRQTLWNAVEKSERRKDALLAREFEIAFPSELNAEQRKKMLDELCQNLVQKHGVIVDAAIHAPHTHGGSDERNYHAHIMFTTRSIDPQNGEFSAKKYRDFSRDSGTQTVSEWREHFAMLTNNHLEKAGYDVRVDHRSYKEQDLGLEATVHEGNKITQLRRRGIETEISVSNDLIKLRNSEKNKAQKLLKEIDQEILTTAKLISHIEQKTTFDSILSEEKTTNFDSFDQITQKMPRIRSEKTIFDTLDASISQLNRSELDKTLESRAETERKAAVKVETEPQEQLNKTALEREVEAERKAVIERDRKNRRNDFNF